MPSGGSVNRTLKPQYVVAAESRTKGLEGTEGAICLNHQDHLQLELSSLCTEGLLSNGMS